MGRRSTIFRYLLTALIPALAACTANKPPPAIDPNLFPGNYKQELAQFLRKMLADPNQRRNALVSDPVLTPVGAEQRYALCVRTNEPDANGKYGPKDRIAYFYGGNLNVLIAATGNECVKAAYKPFPELEKTQ